MTKSPDVVLLEEQAPPRVLVEPQDARANSWEDVADLSEGFGLVLDPWQEDVFRAAMGERSNGKWAAAQVAISAPRQNGKSQMIVARALAGALLFGERLIVISAHQQDTARETFAKFLELRDLSPALAKRMPESGIMNALNREAIRLSNGAVIKFKARSGSGGRGFSSDLLMLDEAQILGSRAWASINSTMSARENPQVWLLGTPPDPEDDSEVFTRIRASALRGGSQRLAYLEWAADPGDDPASDDARAKANPAWHTRINHDVVRGEFETYSPEQFARERLGMWDEPGVAKRVVDFDAWSRLSLPVELTPTEGVLAFAVKFSVDGLRVGCGVALHDGESTHVEALGVAATSDGTGELVAWLVARWRKASVILIDGKAGAGDLRTQLIKAGVSARRVRQTTTDEVITAHSGFLRAINEQQLTHLAQPGLDSAVRAAGKRDIGTAGGWGWTPVTADGDVTSLEAVTLARFGAVTGKRKTGEGRTTSGNRTSTTRRAGVR